MQVMSAVWRNFKFVASGSMIAAACGLVAMTFNARALGPLAFGALVVIQAIAELTNRFAEFQTWQSIINFGSKDVERGDAATLKAHYWFGLSIDFGAAACAALVAFVLLTFFAPLVGLDPRFADHAPVYALICLFAGTGSGIGMMRLAGRFDKVMALQSVQAVVLMINAAVLWWVEAPFAAYIWSIALITAISTVSMNIAGYLQMRRLTAGLVRTGEPAGLDRGAFVRFSLATSATGTLNALRQKGEPLLIGALAGGAAVGAYAAAQRISLIILRFADAARMSVYPEIATLVAKDRAIEARHIAFRTAKLAALVTLPAYAVVVFFGDRIMALAFGPEFADGHLSLIFMITAAGLYSSVFALGPYIQQVYGAGRLLLIYLAGFAGFVVSTVTLLPLFGPRMAGIGTLVYCALYAAICLVVAHRQPPRTPAAEPQIDVTEDVTTPID